MKRFILPFAIMFLISVLIAVTPDGLRQANHSAQAVDMVAANQNQTVRTVRTLPTFFTRFEREARVKAAQGYRVPSVLVIDDWTSPREGHIVVWRDTRRWHRSSAAWRRMA